MVILPFRLFRNDPKTKTYLTVIINICAICLCRKNVIDIITQNMHTSIKVKNTSNDRKLSCVLLE